MLPFSVYKASDREIVVNVPKIGQVKLYRCFNDYPRAWKFTDPNTGITYNHPDRPWHVTTFGRFYAHPRDCCAFLQDVVDHWDDETYEQEWHPVCHGEMTHSFLSLEAELENCP